MMTYGKSLSIASQVTITETAYAKINLALHVRARRDDGYHALETLFAFVDRGDVLTVRQAEQDEVFVSGEFADSLTNTFDNIVSKTLAKLPKNNALQVNLGKLLPVAAGLGGGSADAGALFRLIRDTHGLPEDWAERAAGLGADVPACVDSHTCIGRGTGTDLQRVESDWAGMAVLLVNPRIPLSTGPVFAAWDGEDRGALPSGSVSQMALAGRNDLEGPAIELCPEIKRVLAALRRDTPILARMSGSGATCFAIYENAAQRAAAAERLKRDHPGWWQMQGLLRP